MNCPNCKCDSVRVTNNFPSDDGSIYRHRQCVNCKTNFRTVEVIDDGSEEFKRGYSAAYRKKRNRRNREDA